MKKINKNKKGFTLVELLAVIVILAVLILLATPAILNLSANAQARVFVIQAVNLATAAENRYISAGGGGSACFTLTELMEGGYLRETLANNWQGRVTFTPDGNNTIAHIWLTDGSRWINNITRAALDGDFTPETTPPSAFNPNCP